MMPTVIHNNQRKQSEGKYSSSFLSFKSLARHMTRLIRMSVSYSSQLRDCDLMVDLRKNSAPRLWPFTLQDVVIDLASILSVFCTDETPNGNTI